MSELYTGETRAGATQQSMSSLPDRPLRQSDLEAFVESGAAISFVIIRGWLDPSVPAPDEVESRDDAPDLDKDDLKVYQFLLERDSRTVLAFSRIPEPADPESEWVLVYSSERDELTRAGPPHHLYNFFKRAHQELDSYVEDIEIPDGWTFHNPLREHAGGRP